MQQEVMLMRDIFGGNMMNGEYAWFEDNSTAQTHAVGKTKPNQFGVYDMMGNVWEWVADWYDAAYPRGKQGKPNWCYEREILRLFVEVLLIHRRVVCVLPIVLGYTPKTRFSPKSPLMVKIMNEIYNYVGFRCAQSISQVLN